MLILKPKQSILLLVLSCFIITGTVSGQTYDVLVTESFDNTTNLSTDTGFGNEDKSCTTSDMFDVSATHTDPTDITNSVGFETGSVFCGSDINSISGVSTPSFLDVFSYTPTDNDHISFVGKFAFAVSCGGGQDYNSSDELVVEYSTDGGSNWNPGITLTGTGVGSSLSNTDGDYFAASDGTANVRGDLYDKEFAIGSGLMGQTIVVRVNISGFTSSGEAFFLDEFRLVKTRSSVLCEDFNNTSLLTSSSGSVFQTPDESATCGISALYDVTANMDDPSLANSCIEAEDGSFFVLTQRNNLTGVTDGEELELLTYTATDNNHISFRGNFASFADDQNTDNNIVVSYSTNGGSTYTDALTITGSSGATHTCSDGSPSLGNAFLTKGFSIGGGLSGQVIKVKVTFNNYTNGGDGIALDKFCLESGIAPAVLPVELTRFDGEAQTSKNLLSWTTASEINNDYFFIQRSYDGINFESIGKIKGAGNSSMTIEYQFNDYNPLKTAYYRIKQVDFDGSSSFSRIIVLNRNVTEIDIYPNPINMGSTLSVVADSYLSTIQLYSELGQLVDQFQINLGDKRFEIPLTYPTGIYILKVATNQKSITKKLVIK